jgi:hypothetical protein
MEHFYQKLEGWSTMEDQGELLKEVLKQINIKDKIKILELGVYQGRGTSLWNVELINNGVNYE